MIISKTNTAPIKYYRDGKETTEEEYNKIFELIQNRPTVPVGKGYKLTEDLQWELYELPTEETDIPIETELYDESMEVFGKSKEN